LIVENLKSIYDKKKTNEKKNVPANVLEDEFGTAVAAIKRI
jgi:hypothetical protein